MAATAQDSTAPLRGNDPAKKDEDREDERECPCVLRAREQMPLPVAQRARLAASGVTVSGALDKQPASDCPLGPTLSAHGGARQHTPKVCCLLDDGLPAPDPVRGLRSQHTAEYSPFYGIEKGAVLQEARIFHDPNLDPRRCSQVRRRRACVRGRAAAAQ